jgi:cyclic beta-1,2-glucan synthetase
MYEKLLPWEYFQCVQIREELMILNNEELQTRAHEFALMHEVSATTKSRKPFWPAFRSDMASLHEFAEQLQAGKPICTQPAEDWLLDHINFIETQSQVVIREMPSSVLKKLPRLKSTGLPRIYELCSDYLEHVGGKYDGSSFENYLMSYQDVSVLKDVECWALINAMRIIIIRRLAAVMKEVRYRHNVCRSITSMLEEIGMKNMSDDKIRQLLEEKTRINPLGPIEIVHFVQHLREWEPNIQIVHEWLKAHIENSGTNLEQMVSLENQLQAELQVTCGYLVQSLHSIERLPWRLTFTKISKLEKILFSDPNRDFEKMDLSSRDTLRSRAAKIAFQLNVPETLVAQTAINLAQSQKTNAVLEPRKACLAYYLLDPHGITRLRNELSKTTRPRVLPQVALLKRPSSSYITGTIILFAALMFLAGEWVTYGISVRLLSWVAVFAALLLPVSEWTITVIHDLICKCCSPSALLRYDFSKELPDQAATMVVMPIIWSSFEEVDDVIDRLHVHYLANRQENIYFAILADFADSKTETLPNDREIVEHAIKKLEDIRQKYGKEKFFLFHRSRQFNAVDNIYMGWERKRGKLVEFVELINGNNQTSYSIIDGQRNILKKIRYVFTTDHDTQLPIGTVSRLAGTIHFPYNRPRLNADETAVVEGFGVLQPRIGSSFESTRKSRFAALLAGKPGMDPYAFAVSNAYQDLFGQGIFVGKGIFEVKAFQKTLVNRIPDFQVLSHDLLEGGFLRTGLTSDIEVVESHPGTFYAYQQRAHRWMRGDWQLIKWLGKNCKDRQGESKKVELCGLTRWQIIDNLRRSLMAPILFLIAILGMGILPGRSWVWETIVLVTVFMPFLRDVLLVVFGQNPGVLGNSFQQCFLKLLALPFSAVLSLDAIIRTLYRIVISKKNLLEWIPSAKTDGRASANGKVFMYEGAGYIAGFLFVAAAVLSGGKVGWIFGAIGFILLLLARPIFMQFNKPKKGIGKEWLKSARSELEGLALKIWTFYNRYVTEKESWLPPDNVQYHPGPNETIAHRTSPTNIGLYLACVIAARDLEFISTEEMVKRIKSTINTIEKMEKWNGHLLNWYDTCSAQPLFPKYVSTVDSGNFIGYLMVVRQGLINWSEQEPEFAGDCNKIVAEIDQIVAQTNFEPLYNSDERLFSLGYHVDTNRKDTTLYDLLASEARQASFVAIALGQIPASHWFSLARTMTVSGKHKTLLSWSGTMFEYLMPSLIMRTYSSTIWDSTYRGVIASQRKYAEKYQIPFGISESGYYAFDYQMNYQYRAFGVPGLGLDRDLGKNLVVAPYATIMSLPYAGTAALQAMQQFEKMDANGEFGFFEAVDFTTGRMPKGERYQVIKSYMAHHQGMSMLTLANLLTENLMINRFHADLRVRAADLLLQERIPEKTAFIEEPIGLKKPFPVFEGNEYISERSFTEPGVVPEVNILSNSRMSSIISDNGTGMLTWNGLSITRWIEDPVVHTSGPVIYMHDVTKEETWSITRFPCQNVENEKSIFRLYQTEFEGAYQDIYSKLDITVSPNVDAEVRRLKLVNNSEEERILEVTTFLELALAEPSAINAHPAFSKLFIETSHDAELQCLFAKKRRREEDGQEAWAVHTVFVEGEKTADYEFETDRAKFIGRGYSLQNPKSMNSRLRGLVGSVVDPAFIMRRRIHLHPKETVNVFIVTGAAESHEKVLDIIKQLGSPHKAERTFHMAWVRSQIDLRHRHLTQEQATAAQMLAGRLLFTPPLSLVRSEAIRHNTLGQSALWSHGISGDIPILLVTIEHTADLPFVILLACQHQYLSQLGLQTDFVVLDETIGGYQDQLMNLLRDQMAAKGMGDLKRIIGLKAEQLSDEERTLLLAKARVIIQADGPSLSAQLRMKDIVPHLEPKLVSAVKKGARKQPRSDLSSGLEFFNGWGGFVDDGQAYQIVVQSGSYLPRPWSNIISNQSFGCLVTDFGTGYSWWRNSRECKLTPWTNDPVLDQPGECIYFRDLQTDQIWSGAPKPAGDQFAYRVTHGKGFSRFEQLDGDVSHKMDITVPLNDSLKLIRVSLYNKSENRKHISVTWYAEMVLGVTREMQAPYIVSEWDEQQQALLARNAYQETFRDAISFMHMAAPDSKEKLSFSWTGDRIEFIGQGGTTELPAAVLRKSLSKRTGTFSNTCSALQTVVELAAGEERTLTLLMGCAASKEEVSSLISQYSKPSAFANTLTSVNQYWQKTLGQVQIKTPDRAMDIMMNGWLLYQTLSCRLWARTAFYQAGGAFGFRDQLQDSLAFLHVEPSITRRQILINAAHQYQEGDVQHWWHQETDKGIRTKFSDDLLWLPYTVARYIEQTGDKEILQEIIPFLHSDVLKEDELERYENTVVSEETGTLLDHCLRAIRHALKFGEHGIPLMGIGDWNDGMSRIGAKGRGESVWLGWFLLDILKRFIGLGKELVSDLVSEQFEQSVHELERNLNDYAWDGSWFRRAFTDSGEWIGTNKNQECRIDAIAQSWSVISEGTDRERQQRAMVSFDRELVDRELNLARLLTKPFNQSKPSPGYIQGYPPGIRENGGQYTHGVIWGIVAWAMLERYDKAFELFSMLNPINHTLTFRDVQIFENEPYVMSADVYTASPHQGRGGWSWYTGAAGWMYQAGLEYILGIKLKGNQLSIQPCVPSDWPSFRVDYRYGKATYSLDVYCQQEHGVPVKWIIDGHDAGNQPYLELKDDEQTHQVEVYIGRQRTSTAG